MGFCRGWVSLWEEMLLFSCWPPRVWQLLFHLCALGKEVSPGMWGGWTWTNHDSSPVEVTREIWQCHVLVEAHSNSGFGGLSTGRASWSV